MSQRTTSRTWVTAETEIKERDFRGLIGGIHIPICKGIRAKHGRPTDPPYLYVDLHGGPGHLHRGEKEFPGSPIIATEELDKAELPYESLHFEHHEPTAALLADALYRGPVETQRAVIAEEFETGMNTLLAQMPSHRYRYGLVYSDPIKDPIPVDTFNQVARHFPRVDLLAYVAANDHYKRANANGYGHGRALPEDIAAVNKKIALIREPHTAHQWTFILWSDWTKLPEWRKRGFHRIDEGAGRRILRRVALTKAELHEQENTPLPLDNGLPYRSYREYLRHPRFLKVRTEVFDRAGGKCERCGIRPPTEPHHLRYPPWGTFDVPENLVAICHQCHCDAHGKAS